MNLFSRQDRLNASLMKAAAKGDAKWARKLLDAGAEVDAAGDNPPLFLAAFAGDTDGHHEVMTLLIERGATLDIRNSVNCTPLMGAANQGNTGAARILLKAGANANLVGRDRTVYQWAMTSGSEETIRLLQPKAPRRPDSADEVTVMTQLGNRTLEEVFNFATKERITFVRNGPDGPVEAVTRQNFKDIGDRDALRDAFAKYVAKGGTRAESEIFPEVLVKIRPQDADSRKEKPRHD